MKYILGSDSLTVFTNGEPYTVNRSAEIFNAALQAVREDRPDKFLSVVNTKTTITNKFGDITGLEIRGNRIFYGNREVNGLIASRVFELMRFALDTTPITNFIKNLFNNPSKRAVDEVFGFVDACKLPMTEDGCILAYRRVSEDYTDVHSRTVPNKPADLFTNEEIASMPIVCGAKNEVTVSIDPVSGNTVIQMDRNMVDDDKYRTCSYGLHFCSYEYLRSFAGNRVVVVKINPADIVAIPSDYNNSKGRTCRYEVWDEINTDDSGMPTAVIDVDYMVSCTKDEEVVEQSIDSRNRDIVYDLNEGMTVSDAAKNTV